MGAAGTQTAALAFGGYSWSTFNRKNIMELTWTEVNDLKLQE